MSDSIGDNVGRPATTIRGKDRARVLDSLLGCLSRRIVDEATGTRIPIGTRLPSDPRDKLWLGMLASEPQLIAEAAAGYSLGERRVPPAQGFTFRVRELPTTLRIQVSAAAYISLTPNLDEQKAAVVAEADRAGRTAAQGGGRVPTPTPNNAGHKLAPVWSKVVIDPISITVPITEGSARSFRIGENEVEAAFQSAIKAPPGATLFRPRRQTRPTGSLPRDDDMLDEQTWSRYCATNLVDPDQLIKPTMRAVIEVEVTPGDEEFEILVTVVNTTPAADQQVFDGASSYDESNLNSSLYEVELKASTNSELLDYELEQVAQSYRYDRSVKALGLATPVSVSRDEYGASFLQTLYAAEQDTGRVYPREVLSLPGRADVAIDTSFASLSQDPVGALERLVAAHRAWVDYFWSDAELNRLASERGWDAEALDGARRDADAARKEVAWVNAGVDLLRQDSRVREAFVLANRTVEATAGGAYDSWRPFQVAWIVGCLPAMADPNIDTTVNIVWFATGGGKSEAYLGLMLTTLFYGRLSGVTAGTQVWARFPLRLLALQQMERFAAMVLNAEVLRRSHPDLAGGDPFGIGYFVGGGNTPNKLQRPEPTNPYYRGIDPYSEQTAAQCRLLEVCPLCKKGLEVAFDERSWTMQHICRTAGCDVAGVLPLWGIDDEIYRNAPAVLVGTVDKLAQLGQSRDFQVLLGRAHSRCPAHGYTSNPLYCTVFGCSASRNAIPSGFGALRMEIADELHLLNESLGALDGMYETLLQAISNELGNPPMQIVGATATIEGYENQVDHLYQREARRFPVNGPIVGETFWSTTVDDDPLRRYLGVRPRRVTMVTATREVALAHRGWLKDLLEDPSSVLAEAGLDPSDSGLIEVARAAGQDLYEVFVAYCLRNEDLSSFVRDDSVQTLLGSEDNLAVINGDAEPAKIRDAVRRLLTPPASEAERVKIIAATRAIGHGFDVARLGIMTIMGTPTSAAEIIQASARVGRTHPGLVVNVINPARDRDASVYRYYSAWIRFLDRLVTKVPVNRKSLPVLKRVLSGGLMAWILQYHDRAWLTGGPRRKSLADSTAFAEAVQSGYLDRALLIENLSSGFGIDSTSLYQKMHREEIDSWVDDQLASLPLRAEAGVRLPNLLSPPIPRSLRDVEEPITMYGEI